ncbi:hypothetical protein [Streptomyces sp. 3211]|uniref:hypothetical protein n=1 Tax=Streptomyces sp. 3211 TaxID=1964449 RepID=UPI0013318B6A|nr:hypothetical protein [Streptomyces sp. 3211]
MNRSMQKEQQEVAATNAGTQASITVRPYMPQDLESVLNLIEGDRLPGRPMVTPDMLGHVLAGCCPGDAAPSLLREQRTDVAVDDSGQVVGAIGWGVRAQDRDGLLLWLHCMEDDQMIAQVLVLHMLKQAARQTVHAFGAPTAISFAGLPVGNRRGTAVALEASGFSRQDGWSFLHHRLDMLEQLPYEVIDITKCASDPYGWYVRLRDKNGTNLGRAVVSRPVEGTAVLEWITLAPEPDGSGHLLLSQYLAHLADRGVHELVVLLDASADHTDGGSHGPVRELHQQAGFKEIDQLHPYTRRP